jgi:multidrug efflux pump subunit AcrA (membrane-fusion protein)
MGVLYVEGNYTLGEVSFELSVVKECEQDIWEESILPKFKAEYEKVEAERLEQERIKQEREAELKRQQEELERKQREIEAKEAALKAAQEEQERKEREAHDRRMAEAKAKEEAKWKTHADQLLALGLKIEFFNNHLYYNGYDCSISHLDITGYSDEKWNEMIGKITPHIAAMKALEEEKRLSEIEQQKEIERKRAIGRSRFEALELLGYTLKSPEVLADAIDEQWEQLHEEVRVEYDLNQKKKWEAEQEEKRKQEEIKKQQEMDQAKDKDKWEEIMSKVNEIVVYDMRSSQYRKKAMILREKLQEIKSL